jgi:hypothetical protein
MVLFYVKHVELVNMAMTGECHYAKNVAPGKLQKEKVCSPVQYVQKDIIQKLTTVTKSRLKAKIGDALCARRVSVQCPWNRPVENVLWEKAPQKVAHVRNVILDITETS